MKRIKIYSNMWDDFNILWDVVEYYRRTNSSAIELVLKFNDQIIKRVVPAMQIEWVD